MKTIRHNLSVFIAAVLLLNSVPGLCDSQDIQSSLIAQIIELKPTNVEASAAVVEGFSRPADKMKAINGKIEVKGFATTVDLARYLEAVTASNVGAVDVKEITPTVHNGRRLSQFVFQISVSMPENCKEIGGVMAGDDLKFSRRACGATQFSILSHLLYRDENRHAVWGIIDFVKLPDLKKNETFGEVDCTYKFRKPQGDTFALLAIIGPYTKTNDLYKTKVSYAIRPNLKTQRLDILKPSSVTCDYKDTYEDRD